MTTTAMIGLNTLFKIGDGAGSETFTTVAEVTSIKPPGLSRDAIDATHSESPSGWREYIAGLKDGGEVSIDINFDPGSTTTDLLTDQFATSTVGNKKVLFPDGTEWAFKAIMTGFEPDAPVDDKMSATVTFKVSGAPTFTQA